MATVSDLKAVLKDTLEKRGVLGHLKARIRAEVFNALDDENEPRPTLSHENLLINELIREYLEFNKYKYTASVLIAESGQPVVPLDRQFLIRELNAFEESKDNTIPLLYGILAHFLHGIKDGIQTTFLKGSSLQPRNPNLGRQPSGRKQMVPETSESQVPVNEALGAYSVESSVEDSEMRMTAEPIEEQWPPKKREGEKY